MKERIFFVTGFSTGVFAAAERLYVSPFGTLIGKPVLDEMIIHDVQVSKLVNMITEFYRFEPNQQYPIYLTVYAIAESMEDIDANKSNIKNNETYSSKKSL